MNENEIAVAVALWEQKVADYETKVEAAAELTDEFPVFDVSSVLVDCPRPVLHALLARRRNRSPEAREKLQHAAWKKRVQADAAERLAVMLEEKGKPEQAAAQRARAVALVDEVTRLEKEVLS